MNNNNNKNRRINLVIGVTASVATIKLDELIENILIKLNNNVNICLIPTQNSLHFIKNINKYTSLDLNNRLDLLKQQQQQQIMDANNKKDGSILIGFTDQDEWSSWSKRNDPVLHIELRKWADMLLIAPLDANTLAKIR